MKTIDVSLHIEAPVEDVWDFLTDHEGMTFAREVSMAKLLREGDTERNGVGALRKVRAVGVTFEEEITRFDRPNCMEYRVRKCTIPTRHELGRIELTPEGSGTEIHWISRFESPVPIIGPLTDPLAKRIMGWLFLSGLKQAKQKLEAPSA